MATVLAPYKVRWGELDEDDGEDLDFLLPPSQVIGPDENGMKKVIEYKFNDDGNKVKITTTTRVRKLAKARLSKGAVERRSLAKFGDAVHEDVGSRLTMVSTEEILLERPRAPAMATVLAPYKVRWGELDEDDGEDLDFLLPPSQVIGPDENGMKKVIEYKFNDDGNKVKITTTTRVRKLAKARLSKGAVERRSLPKFGDAVHEDVGSRLTMVSTEEILLERPRAPATKAEESKVLGDPLAQIGKGGAVLMVCRTCGKKGDHWTSRCPYKDLAPQTDTFVDKPPASETTLAPSGATKGAYVPPSMRGGGAERPGGSEMRRRNEENSVRVTNLSEETRERDLLELFRTFGLVSRVYVAIDQKTGMSRGFGFVNFVHKEDAERAISKLNGYAYDHLILRVEWATPRANF